MLNKYHLERSGATVVGVDERDILSGVEQIPLGGGWKKVTSYPTLNKYQSEGGGWGGTNTFHPTLNNYHSEGGGGDGRKTSYPMLR